ncbi:hypothetical protein [Bombilactobacillus thymidiniphilus]|uniref:Lipoprotein n=1 Tax=Bombilactobacillus thymidiniphilus TaxID=2923363 RepID=A0ABY4PCY0_9LACO|nr:hypothetical protein [Bombilactobacillus thymidiniphilus]UQS83504.1 hypothetical protein MOO47_06950 [Bombilactobacillus thymidiniphilus]
MNKLWKLLLMLNLAMLLSACGHHRNTHLKKNPSKTEHVHFANSNKKSSQQHTSTIHLTNSTVAESYLRRYLGLVDDADVRFEKQNKTSFHPQYYTFKLVSTSESEQGASGYLGSYRVSENGKINTLSNRSQ